MPCSTSKQALPLVELNGRLIEESQKTLARLSIPQRAYELLKSQARTSTAGRLGSGAKGRARTSLACLRPPAIRRWKACGCPNFSPISDFGTILLIGLPILPTASSATAGSWARPATSRRWPNSTTIFPTNFLPSISQDFIATWQTALDKLRLRKLTGDKPQYIAFSAISAPTSPLTQLIESIGAETMLTRERTQHR